MSDLRVQNDAYLARIPIGEPTRLRPCEGRAVTMNSLSGSSIRLDIRQKLFSNKRVSIKKCAFSPCGLLFVHHALVPPNEGPGCSRRRSSVGLPRDVSPSGPVVCAPCLRVGRSVFFGPLP